MAKIFVCYRRDDAFSEAGRITDWLDRRFGEDEVFMDINTIGLGDDFVEKIQGEIDMVDALIAVIGPKWLEMADDQGNRRLDDSGDFVRLEIAQALRRGIRVIPVLVQGARMPPRSALPKDIQPLTRRNGLILTNLQFKAGIGELIDALGGVVTPQVQVRPAPEPEPSPQRAQEPVPRSQIEPVAKTAGAGLTEAPAEAAGASAVRVTGAEKSRALALRSFRALGPLRVAVIFAAAGLLLFLGPRGTGAYTTLGSSPLNRLGTLTIGAGVVVAVALAAPRVPLNWAASFVVALALQEAFGAAATVVVEISRDGQFIPNRHRYVIGAAVVMALAAVAAAATIRHNFGRRRHTRPTWAPLVVASIGAATAFAPLLFSPLTVDAAGSIEQLFYENPWYRLEPIGIATASAFGVLLVYRAAPRIAAGWLAGTAVNALLYAAGVAAFASSTFGGYSNEIRPSGLALFGTAALLTVASALCQE
jgi:hypothetical protein